MADAMRASINGALPEAISGLPSTAATIAPGEAYFAIKGDIHDGHDFVAAALKSGAALAVVEAAQARQVRQRRADCWWWMTCWPVWWPSLMPRARGLHAQVIAITGSVGKTSTKEALRRVLDAKDRHTPRPLRSTITGACRCHWRDVRVGAFRDLRNRHESRRRNRDAGEDGAAAGGRDHHGGAGCIWNSSPASRRLPMPRRKFFNDSSPVVAVVLNRDNSQFDRLQQSANKLGVSRIVSFGADKQSDARLLEVSLHADRSAVHANILGHDVTYKLGMPGRQHGDEFAGGAGCGVARGRRSRARGAVAVARLNRRRAAVRGARWRSLAARRH